MKYLSILISNSSNNISKDNNNFNFYYYLCNNGYINQIIIFLNHNNEEQDDDYLTFYINFLKSINNKINFDILKLIFHFEYNIFPLLDHTLILLNHEDIMIRTSARNIFLSLIKINYFPIIEYLCNLPRISIFIILIQKIKIYFLLLIKLKNNDQNFFIEKTKELKEKILEDFLFIQDIMSINIYKINYIIINCIFSILFIFLFSKIISFSNYINDVELKSEISKSINILKIILKNIKNENIKNIIFLLLFSDKIYSQINEYFNNFEKENKDFKKENQRLLNLNTYIFNYNFSKLEFKDFIILNYSINFFKSINYINIYKIYTEFNEIYNIIKENNNVDAKTYIQLLDDKYIKNNEDYKIRMINYHNYI